MKGYVILYLSEQVDTCLCWLGIMGYRTQMIDKIINGMIAGIVDGIIVGRAIYEAEDPAQAALEYSIFRS